MVAILDQLALTELVTGIPGISAVGSAAMLAEIGDPTRFDSARALVRHAGLCPRENTSGTFSGQSRISRRGRPGLRLAAWRAVWGALPHNPVMAARYQHLTTRNINQLKDGQARAALAAALDPRHHHRPHPLGRRSRRRRQAGHRRLTTPPRTGWGQAPPGVEDHLDRHHEQAPPLPHRTRLHAVGNHTPFEAT
ncbi:IS110 family transposase [Mycobacterium sp.]|uniref:IS110 family transposase n=1 Tax=Mycobacterium sp. TaxID=1785 RepID=UPI002C9BF59D|nr:IS110 family transposase [Mycobacterium sp.]HTQ17731.1 IS110 family transposase [Mycobacterium sp.]